MSYVFMLIAFYVDNGKQLPVWKGLPQFTYWLLPVTVATPLIVWALFSHPLVQAYQLDRREKAKGVGANGRDFS